MSLYYQALRLYHGDGCFLDWYAVLIDVPLEVCASVTIFSLSNLPTMECSLQKSTFHGEQKAIE